MPIEPSEWPSPSAPDIVRARIRARSKTLIRRKLAVAAAALCTVVVALGVPGLDGSESTQRLHFADEPGEGGGEVGAVDGLAPRSGEVSADGDRPEAGAPGGPRQSTGDSGQPGAGPGSQTAGSDPRQPARSMRQPLVTDPAGDAGAEGTPSIDLQAGSVWMEGGLLVVAASVVDLETGPQPTGDFGMDMERWMAHLGYGDGAFTFFCERVVATGASGCGGIFTRSHDVDEGAGNHVEEVPIEASVGGGDAVVFRARIEDMNAALARDPRRDYAPLRAGTSLTASFESMIARGAVVAGAYTSRDAMGSNTRYRLGD